jgi:dUTP pyrophosphatase
MPRLVKLDNGDWVDLYLVDIVNLPDRFTGDGWHIRQGDILQISLGVSMELPAGYEAIIAPRSSLFKRHGLILANSIGIIDNSYRGDDDIWGGYLFCLTGETFIKKYERILQFRIIKNQPNVKFEMVDNLNNDSRGGFGSTGI